MSCRRCGALVVVIALASVYIGCEIEVPLVDPDARGGGSADAYFVDGPDSGGGDIYPDAGSRVDADVDSGFIPDAGM